MLVVETVARIRREFFVKGKSGIVRLKLRLGQGGGKMGNAQAR